MDFEHFLSKLMLCISGISRYNCSLYSLASIHYKLFPKYDTVKVYGVTVNLMLSIILSRRAVSLCRHCILDCDSYEFVRTVKLFDNQAYIGFNEMQKYIMENNICNDVSFVQHMFKKGDLRHSFGRGITLRGTSELFYLDDEFEHVALIDNISGVYASIVRDMVWLDFSVFLSKFLLSVSPARYFHYYKDVDITLYNIFTVYYTIEKDSVESGFKGIISNCCFGLIGDKISICICYRFYTCNFMHLLKISLLDHLPNFMTISLMCEHISLLNLSCEQDFIRFLFKRMDLLNCYGKNVILLDDVFRCYNLEIFMNNLVLNKVDGIYSKYLG